MIEFVVDILIAVLLAGTIGLTLVLYRRLQAFKSSQAELAKLLEGFGEATARAEASVARLKVAAAEAGTRLAEETEKARALANELAFLVKSGDGVVTRLDRAGPGGRVTPPSRPTVVPPPAAPAEDAPRARTLPKFEPPAVDEEDETPVAATAGTRPGPRPVPASGGRAAAHAAYARGLVQGGGEARPGDNDGRDPSGARSAAEKELLDMLRSAR